ncbi:hypothetical protein BCR33DRAFT_710967 [Rhizoclosmatium globosum]|uniref:G-protein coupled receptors family 1 profile domain-containing protein n=1 Tax=Rhizoclosmatium globosum TaxID=329046 RepID=A0A1Y2D2P9_9FUNG|nr:hypothetical protein BCR33DRAFT_710967 [Rhizoclosmatium globosum]|eukprot:ORY53568.1 hypothetical protein BCR33DRAFT_710967 [Rhizoclosmatium globosum]
MIANMVSLLPIGDSITCLSVQLYANFFYHTIPFTFDTFILYRSWIISGRNKTCCVISIILIGGRLVWGLWDILKSGGQWDEASMSCNFIQDPISLIGYSWVDIICDLFATVVAVVVIARQIGWDFADTNYMTVMSIFRSSLVASTNIAVMVTGSLSIDPFWVNVAWAIQIYVLCRCLNVEIILPEMEKTVTQLARIQCL